MSNTSTPRRAGKRWRWLVLGTLGVAGIGGGWYGIRSSLLSRVQAAPTAPANAATQAPQVTDQRVVAYLHHNEAITREELGNYLVARRGPGKLDAYINRRIIDQACKSRNITVTAQEVEASFIDSIKELNIAREQFVNQYLRSIGKNLFEWKEDVLRPKLMLKALCEKRVTVSEEELARAFESKYGEKVECRIIVWTYNEKNDQFVKDNYARYRDSEEAFAEMAKKQEVSALAAGGGKVKPVGRFTFSDRNVEDALFKLRDHEVSLPIVSQQVDPTDHTKKIGTITLIKRDGHIAADTSVSLAAKHDELKQEVHERKLQLEIAAFVKEMRTAAAVTPAYPQVPMMDKMLQQPGPANQVLATIYGNIAITRQDLGEYLIVRYGGEALDLLINRKIIDEACAARKITVTDNEVNAAYLAELTRLKIEGPQFTKDFLAPYGKTLFEWKEDVLRPKLLMAKLVRETMSPPTDEEVKMAYDAFYGEQVEGRLILWKTDEKRFIFPIYDRLRDSDSEFVAAAKRQFTPALAAKEGKVPKFARHTTGCETLEEKAFGLQPGEITSIMDLPEGCAIFKCDKKYPAKTYVKLEQARAQLIPIIYERKAEAMIPETFKKLRAQASPQPLIRNASALEDLGASVLHDLNTPQLPSNPSQRR